MNQDNQIHNRMEFLMGELLALISTKAGWEWLDTERGEIRGRELADALQAVEWDRASRDHCPGIGPENETRRAA